MQCTDPTDSFPPGNPPAHGHATLIVHTSMSTRLLLVLSLGQYPLVYTALSHTVLLEVADSLHTAMKTVNLHHPRLSGLRAFAPTPLPRPAWIRLLRLSSSSCWQQQTCLRQTSFSGSRLQYRMLSLASLSFGVRSGSYDRVRQAPPSLRQLSRSEPPS